MYLKIFGWEMIAQMKTIILVQVKFSTSFLQVYIIQLFQHSNRAQSLNILHVKVDVGPAAWLELLQVHKAMVYCFMLPISCFSLPEFDRDCLPRRPCVSCIVNLIEVWSLEPDVQVYSSLIRSSITWFKCSCLQALGRRHNPSWSIVERR